MIHHFAKVTWFAYAYGLISLSAHAGPTHFDLRRLEQAAALTDDQSSTDWDRHVWPTAAREANAVQRVPAFAGETNQIANIFAGSINVYRFALIQGLPESFKLTSGLLSGKGWLISKSDAENLQIQVPEGFEGIVAFQILFFSDVGKAPADSMIVHLQVTPRDAGKSSAKAATPEHVDQQKDRSPVAAEATSVQPKPPPAIEESLLGKAAQLRANGDVAGARLLYEKLAEMGSDKGALYMAESFDPLLLKSSPGSGSVRPNPAKAAYWYEIARKLGNARANDRLNTIK